MLLFSKLYSYSKKIPEDFGYRPIAMKYQDEPVDIIVISKKGEEKLAKPIFFFCQESLPKPVIKYDERGLYPILPFDENPFLEAYHIVIAGKPFIPIISDVKRLGNNCCYFKDIEKQIAPRGYSERNYLDYYVFRNNFILKQLAKERWVKNKKLVVAGYGEGSTIASKMAAVNKKITHLIYSGGNPYGRIMTILAQCRSCDTDTLNEGNTIIEHWQKAVQHANDIHVSVGEPYKTMYSFSLSQKDNIINLKIPVLVCYGTKDWSVSFNDLFQIEAIREKKENISFKSYLNLVHDDFCLPEDRNGNQQLCNWDKIGEDWLCWLKSNG